MPDTDDRFPRVAGLVSPPRRSVVCIVSSILMRRGRKDSADKSDTLARVCISRCEPMGNELTGLLRGDSGIRFDCLIIRGDCLIIKGNSIQEGDGVFNRDRIFRFEEVSRDFINYFAK